MTYTLTIPGKLPGLNEYIRAERSHRQIAAKLKKDREELIAWQIKQQLKGVTLDGPVMIRYTWYEPDKRRDKDNIAFAKKFIQDSLVRAGVLRGDGWKDIAGFTDSFGVDSKNPRIVVKIVDKEDA